MNRIHPLPLSIVALLLGTMAGAQYEGDNVRYRTITLEDLPGALSRSPDALVIDVRTPGEYSDTSHWASLNIGHIKGARNIDHREVAKRLNEFPDRKQPIYLYCSHSQRSRRVGNMLVDSGYTNVVNVDGGMSRYWAEQDRLPVMNDLIGTSTGYGIVNARRLCDMRASRPVFLLDVRADSLIGPGKKPEWVGAYGAMKGSTRIPIERLKENEAQVPRDRPIVVVGAYTADAAKAASALVAQGFSDVHILFNGLEGMMEVSDANCPCKKGIWSSDVAYSAIGLDRLDTLALLSGKAVMLDMRSKDEYDGTAKEVWMNVGRFRTARHIAPEELREKITSAGLAKSTPLVLAGRGLDEELFNAARVLTDLGYKNVSILTTGVWGIRWEAHNLPGHAAWDAWVIPYPTAVPTNP